MKFSKTLVHGAAIIELEKIEDSRGFFARAWCKNEFKGQGIDFEPRQANMSLSKKRGTIRGLHYQVAPHQEAKLMRCIRGAIFDVIVDLRPDSPTYLLYLGVELSANNRQMLYIPEGCAHGYQALADDTEVLYFVSCDYAPGFESGIRWDDPTFKIEWPEQENPIVSEKDQNWPTFDESDDDTLL